VKLRALRKAAGLSTTQLASRVDVSEITVRTWESGKYNPSEERMIKLANVFGCHVWDFTIKICTACGQPWPEAEKS
jgi:transcriptional regulator with XRE-family HTH domain